MKSIALTTVRVFPSLTVFLLFILVGARHFQAQPDYEWAKGIGSPTSDKGHSVAIDSEGNSFITGDFNGLADFDPGPGVTNLDAEFVDLFVAKFDPNGNLLWATSFGSSGLDTGSDIAVDALGNVYITGKYDFIVDFDPGPGVANLSADTSREIFILKLTSDGQFVWVKKFTGPNDEGDPLMTIDASGNLHIATYFIGTVDFDPGAGTANLTSSSSNVVDIAIVKLNSLGELVWAKKLGSAGLETPFGIALDETGAVYTTGEFSGTSDFNPGSSTSLLTASANDVFISKLSSDGNYVWAKKIGGNSDDYCSSLSIDPGGAVIINGNFGSTVDFDPGTNTYNLTAAGSYNDLFTLKLDFSGNFLWVQQFANASGTSFNSSQVDESGNIFFSGFFASMDFDPSEEVVSLSAVNFADVFLLKLDSNGNFQWVQSFGGNGQDKGYGLVMSDNGNIFMTGSFSTTADFNGGTATNNLTSVGVDDIFLLKLSQCANTSSSLTTSACDSYTLNAQTYLESGTYTQVIPNAGGCDSTITLNLTILSAPSLPDVISGMTEVCAGNELTYSVIEDPNASEYVWTLPEGWEGISNSPLIETIADSVSGDILVTAVNSCGSSLPQSLSIDVNTAPQQPTGIEGETEICQGSTNIFAVANDANADEYIWTLPNGWSGASNTNSIESIVGAESGDILVTAVNSCGSSLPQSLNVVVNSAPDQPDAIEGSTELCDGQMYTFSVPFDPEVTDYIWTFPDGWIYANNNFAIYTEVVETGGTISVSIANECGTSIPQTLEVTISSPDAQFDYTANFLEVEFTNQSSETDTWEWTFGDDSSSTEENPIHAYEESGTYEVCLVASIQQCYDTLCTQITVTDIGVDEFALSNVSVYPNPSTGVYNVVSTIPFECDVLDSRGLIIYREKLWSTHHMLDLRNVSPGIYFLRMRSNNSTRSLRIEKIE